MGRLSKLPLRRPSAPLPPVLELSEDEDDKSTGSDPFDDARSVVSRGISFLLPSPSVYSQNAPSRPPSMPPPPPPHKRSSSSISVPLPAYVEKEATLPPRAERVRSIAAESYTRKDSPLVAETRMPSALICDFSPYLFDEKDDVPDPLHSPGPRAIPQGICRRLADPVLTREKGMSPSMRTALNMGCLASISLAFVFAGLFVPIWLAVRSGHLRLGAPAASPAGNGTSNSTSSMDSGWQTVAPFGLRPLIDKDTPSSVYNRTGYDGQAYSLVFSDEFEQDGRTFEEGDDPFFTAQDLHYRATGDWEYYSPENAQTRNGALEILIEKVDPATNHNLSYRSAMISSWNQLCFTGALIEVAATLPGNGSTGFWSAAWTMGNLGRAGYQASTDGIWPYSYSSCDIGTLPNQTSAAGPLLKDGFSYLPGQRLSACTCSGDDHPGPLLQDGKFAGRSAPEIDIFESTGPAFSQTYQVGPFDNDHMWHRNSSTYRIYANDFASQLNDWPGNNYQEAVSSSSTTADNAFTAENGEMVKYAVEYSPTSTGNGHITWSQQDQPTFTIFDSAIGPNAKVEIAQRPISEEPHYLIFNTAISESFSGGIDHNLLDSLLPAKLRIDYVRVYQRVGHESVSCSPPSMPTEDYIQKHLKAYTDWELGIWADAGFSKPRNTLVDQC